MHSKRRYKICICLVMLGELETFRNLHGLQSYLPENLRCNCTFYENENFSYSSLHQIFESENFILFFYEKLPNISSKIRKIKPENLGFFEELRKFVIISRIQAIENSRQYLLLRTDKIQIVGCPWVGYFRSSFCSSWCVLHIRPLLRYIRPAARDLNWR